MHPLCRSDRRRIAAAPAPWAARRCNRRACAAGTKLSKVVLTLYNGKVQLTLTNAYNAKTQLKL